MDPLSVLAWILFYMVIVAMFYWCFRQSMAGVREGAATQPTIDGETVGTAETATTRSNAQRQIYSMPGPGRNVYVISDEMNNRSDEPPPTYKWEDLPPSYEDVIQLYNSDSNIELSAVGSSPPDDSAAIRLDVTPNSPI